jgi:hypothetical protein
VAAFFNIDGSDLHLGNGHPAIIRLYGADVPDGAPDNGKAWSF